MIVKIQVYVFVPGHEILETLKEEINTKCSFSVSIGSSRLIEDDLGIMDDWIERINNNLKQAQKNGKNQVCFGGTIITDNDYEPESKVRDVSVDIVIGDDPVAESLIRFKPTVYKPLRCVYPCTIAKATYCCFVFVVICLFFFWFLCVMFRNMVLLLLSI